jgi:DNA polymerase elongation subunit (family B)
LRSYYKNPLSIAHKVLADRIATRDPGNKPRSGDRIPFVYINYSPIGGGGGGAGGGVGGAGTGTGKKILQGDKIETPSYISEKNLKIDYSFYITNQIMKPVQQIFSLVIERIWEMQNKKSK